MKTCKITIIIVLTLSMFACSSYESANVDSAEKGIAADSHNLDIELNAGEKWKVNEQMMPFIKSSEKQLKDYQKDANRDYKSLAAELKDKNSKLIASCTMSGEAHDALHVWLVPHLDLVGELEESQTVEDSFAVIERLNHSFKAFDNYFQ